MPAASASRLQPSTTVSEGYASSAPISSILPTPSRSKPDTLNSIFAPYISHMLHYVSCMLHYISHSHDHSLNRQAHLQTLAQALEHLALAQPHVLLLICLPLAPVYCLFVGGLFAILFSSLLIGCLLGVLASLLLGFGRLFLFGFLPSLLLLLCELGIELDSILLYHLFFFLVGPLEQGRLGCFRAEQVEVLFNLLLHFLVQFLSLQETPPNALNLHFYFVLLHHHLLLPALPVSLHHWFFLPNENSHPFIKLRE